MVVFRRLQALISQENEPQSVVKSGVACSLLMAMDDVTLRSHIRLTGDQFDTLNDKLGQMVLAAEEGSSHSVPLHIKTLMFLWYMANRNSFREIANKVLLSEIRKLAMLQFNCL